MNTIPAMVPIPRQQSWLAAGQTTGSVVPSIPYAPVSTKSPTTVFNERPPVELKIPGGALQDLLSAFNTYRGAGEVGRQQGIARAQGPEIQYQLSPRTVETTSTFSPMLIAGVIAAVGVAGALAILMTRRKS